MSARYGCARCHHARSQMAKGVALWTPRIGGPVDALCQEHLDAEFDSVDKGWLTEPERVEWLDGSRTLVAA